MTRYPRDRFDDVADGPRVGAHRGLPRRGRGWILVAWSALACAVLVAIGIVVLEVANNSTQFTDPGTTRSSASASATSGASSSSTTAATAAPSDQPKTMTLTVLNGTSTAGLAATGTATLENAGWVVASDGNAGSQDASQTIVYYQTDAEAAIARGIVKTLGVGTVAKSSAFPNAAVTVVLGADYAG
ncbi:LytR C-terminal domain-containing protein [Curtobacterium sp. MCBD17_035]|uniref:LytR C-terminal domain-containing protein n=1 Tax=Curtobacterium sp. MCBD17_035 TaxID=2175673 RepID=UPI000DA8A5F5|nr:LytR C-terminal domain-containing protein [Curtobacterium sp. MCBD17_035]WIB67071.1 LytR C-terminal domain-containing protein [Curtobacterium sp. MCBD17_035]